MPRGASRTIYRADTMERTDFRFAVPMALAASSIAMAGFAHDESGDGDLSDDRLAPTAIELTAGLNRIRGSFGPTAVPEVHDLDYATFLVPDGFVLDAFTVIAADVGGAFSFLAIERGPAITIPWDWTSVESPLLGWAHFGTASVGSDLLPELGLAPGAVGFTGPLPAGTYSIWIMELDMGREYSWDFGLNLTAVPTPGPACLLGAASLLARRRARDARPALGRDRTGPTGATGPAIFRPS